MKTILILSLMMITAVVFSDEKGHREEIHGGVSQPTMVTDVAVQHYPDTKDDKKDEIKEEKKDDEKKEEVKEEDMKEDKKGHHEEIYGGVSQPTMVTDVAVQHRPDMKDNKDNKKEVKGKPITRKKGNKKMPKWLKEDGLFNDKFISWGGFGTHLYGYYDERYDEYDQSAYLKTSTFNLGVEYYKAGFGNTASFLKDIKAGFNIAFQKRNAFTPKKLSGMMNIPERTVPEEEETINAESWLNLGFFVGLDNKWYGIDFGLTVSLNPYYEKERVFKDGTKEEGRGWLWGSGTSLYPNIQFRLGKEDSAHFIFNVLREDYDVKYGVINVYVSLPVNKYFDLDVGGYLYQTDSIFIAPKIKFNGFSAKFKFGTIINYQDEIFEKVAIFDSLFGNVALAYEW